MIDYQDYLNAIGALSECDFKKLLDDIPKIPYISDNAELFPGMEDYEVALEILGSYIESEFNIDVDSIDLDERKVICLIEDSFIDDIEELNNWLNENGWELSNYEEIKQFFNEKECWRRNSLLQKIKEAPIEKLEEFVKQLN